MKDKQLREALGVYVSLFSDDIKGFGKLGEINRRIDNIEEQLLGKIHNSFMFLPRPSVDDRLSELNQKVDMLIDYLGVEKKTTSYKIEFVKKEKKQEGK